MQRLAKIGATLRNNWKKSIAAGLAGTYLVQWQKQKWEDNDYMRALAREAYSYGSQCMGVDAKNYAVTVILNPVSGGVKGRTLYEAHCAPLLHLAGFKVSVIRTESDGQAKEIMQLMKDADAVLVAGGDGTVMEVVTGLMRREDRDAAAQVPIGILPVGKNNLTAKSLFPGADNQVRLLGEATMAVVRQLRRPTGVIEVENQTVGKSIYAMSQLDLGAWKDTRLLIDKWFLSFDWMKQYTPQALYARAYLTKNKYLTLDCNLEVKYQEKVKRDNGPAAESGNIGNGEKAGQGIFSSWFGGQKVEEKTKTLPALLQWQTKEHHGSGMTIESNGEELKASLAPLCTTLGDFTSYGASLMDSRSANHPGATNITSPAILISPIVQPEIEEQENVLNEEEGRKICVDGDDIEFSGPLMITFLKDRISLFCSKSLVREEIPSSSAPPSQRWSSVSSLSLARRAKI